MNVLIESLYGYACAWTVPMSVSAMKNLNASKANGVPSHM